MLPFIVLVGLPGAGKSAAGRAAAQQLGCDFMDFDQEIEKREGRTVQEIFRDSGEPHFRQLEISFTRELVNQELAKATILSPGGGWITNQEAVAVLRPHAHLVYLKATPEAVLGRMGEGALKRPLLAGDEGRLQGLNRLYDARKALYEGADTTIDTTGFALPQVAGKIAELAFEVWGNLG